MDDDYKIGIVETLPNLSVICNQTIVRNNERQNHNANTQCFLAKYQ